MSIRSFLKCLLSLMLLIRVGTNYCPHLCHCYGNPASRSWYCPKVTSLAQIHPTPSVLKRLILDRVVLNDTWAYQSSPLVLKSVRKLEIHQSAITTINRDLIRSFPSLVSIRFVNSRIKCSHSLLALRYWSAKVMNFSSLLCFRPSGLVNRSVDQVLGFMQHVQDDCPVNCSCSLLSVAGDGDGVNSILDVNVKINCSRMHFTSLPSRLLQKWTIHLDFSHNDVKDLTLLSASPIYYNVTVLNLSHNRIDSIDVLNHSDWLGRFTALNLHSNRLTELSAGMLEAALVNGSSFRYQPLLVLGNNPWNCSCHTVTNLQDLVVKQLFRVVDGDSLFCSAQDGAKKLITAELQHQLCNASLTAMPGSFTSSLLDVVVTFVATNVITVVIYHCYSIYNRRLWSVVLYFTSPPQL